MVRTAAAQVVAAELDAHAGHEDGVIVLHDRWVPGGGGAYVDHVVVNAAGVRIVDAVQRDGRVEARDVGRFLRSDPRLFVAKRDASRLVVGTCRQVEAVRGLLGPYGDGVAVEGLLCFVGASWGRRRRPFAVGGVTITWPEELPRILDGPAVLGPHQVDEIARTLDRGLPCR
jgi:hypothetical protein